MRKACITHLADIRAFVSELATAAGIEDPQRFARQWQILMKGWAMGDPGLEPGTSSLSEKRSNRLS